MLHPGENELGHKPPCQCSACSLRYVASSANVFLARRERYGHVVVYETRQESPAQTQLLTSYGAFHRQLVISSQEIGFLTPKPVVYVANLPEETVAPHESGDATDGKANADGAEAIARVALAHADQILGMEREHGVPAVAGCLRTRQGQDAAGAKVSCYGLTAICGTVCRSGKKQKIVRALFWRVEMFHSVDGRGDWGSLHFPLWMTK